MNLKKIISLLLALVVIGSFGILAFANELTGEYILTGKASKTTELSAGDTFTYSIYVSEKDATVPLTIVTTDAEWNITMNYDKSAFSLEGDPTLNYGFSIQSNMSTNGEGYYSASVLASTDSITFESETPFITYTFKVLDNATNGEKTFSVTGVNFTDLDSFGAISDDNENIVSKDMPSVSVGSQEPTYPNLKEEIFTEAKEVNGIAVNSDSKVWTVFQKNSTGATLAANTYGISVVTGGKTYKFAGIEEVAVDGIWAIKLVAPEQKFAEGDTFAPTSIKAYMGTTVSDELITD